MNVRDQDDVYLHACFDRGDVGSFLVEKEGRNIDRHLCMDRGAVFLHCLFLHDPKDVQRGGFDRPDEAGAAATGAGLVRGFAKRGLEALTRKLHQAETRDLAHLDPGTVESQRITKQVFHFALVALVLHIDEVDDDQAAEVTEAQLACGFFRRFAVGAEGRLFDVMTFGGTRGVHIHRHQRLGMVDYDCAAGGQRDLPREGGLDLMLDLEAREQRNRVVVVLHHVDLVRHHGFHERPSLVIDVLGVDQDLADIVVEIVADRAHHEIGFEIDQVRAGIDRLVVLVKLGLTRSFNRLPDFQEVVEVPLKFLKRTPDACRAADHAHALGHFELVHQVAQFVAVFALDTARYAATSGVVRHQDDVASCEADECGEGGALGTSLVLFNLDDEFLAFVQRILDARLADFDAGLEIRARNFLERQEAVTLGSIINERRFEAGLDAGDDCFVNIALALFFTGRFDVEVKKLLAIDDCDTEFLGLCRVKQHALHYSVLPRAERAGPTLRL